MTPEQLVWAEQMMKSKGSLIIQPDPEADQSPANKLVLPPEPEKEKYVEFSAFETLGSFMANTYQPKSYLPDEAYKQMPPKKGYLPETGPAVYPVKQAVKKSTDDLLFMQQYQQAPAPSVQVWPPKDGKVKSKADLKPNVNGDVFPMEPIAPEGYEFMHELGSDKLTLVPTQQDKPQKAESCKLSDKDAAKIYGDGKPKGIPVNEIMPSFSEALAKLGCIPADQKELEIMWELGQVLSNGSVATGEHLAKLVFDYTKSYLQELENEKSMPMTAKQAVDWAQYAYTTNAQIKAELEAKIKKMLASKPTEPAKDYSKMSDNELKAELEKLFMTTDMGPMLKVLATKSVSQTTGLAAVGIDFAKEQQKLSAEQELEAKFKASAKAESITVHPNIQAKIEMEEAIAFFAEYMETVLDEFKGKTLTSDLLKQMAKKMQSALDEPMISVKSQKSLADAFYGIDPSQLPLGVSVGNTIGTGSGYSALPYAAIKDKMMQFYNPDLGEQHQDCEPKFSAVESFPLASNKKFPLLPSTPEEEQNKEQILLADLPGVFPDTPLSYSMGAAIGHTAGLLKADFK